MALPISIFVQSDWMIAFNFHTVKCNLHSNILTLSYHGGYFMTLREGEGIRQINRTSFFSFCVKWFQQEILSSISPLNLIFGHIKIF